MKPSDVRSKAFAMPLTSPAFPMAYRFVDREFLIITYRTDPDRLREIVPEPLQVTEPLVHYEFIRMADSTGFGDYTESGQVIPSNTTASRAAIRSRCISTITRRSPAAASCGASRRSSRRPRCT